MVEILNHQVHSYLLVVDLNYGFQLCIFGLKGGLQGFGRLGTFFRGSDLSGGPSFYSD